MTDHKTGPREEWLAARLELLKAEKALTRHSDELARERRELPWVRIDKEYRFETDGGTASLADLFRGRSQMLVYHFMFGPEYTAGCPNCSAIADGFDGSVVHLANHDVTLHAVSRAPLTKLQSYKRRMGWSFPWASSFDSDFNYDFGVSHTTDEWESGATEYNFRAVDFRPAEQSPALAELASTVGTDFATYRREGPGVSAFALDDGDVYHTYSTYERGWTLSGLCTPGWTARHAAETRPASGGAATTNTTANDNSAGYGQGKRTPFPRCYHLSAGLGFNGGCSSAQFERRVVARAVSQSIASIDLTTEPKATTIVTEQTVGASSEGLLTDGESEVEQIRAQALGRWFKSIPALAGIGYGVAWIAGLAAWPSNLAIDASKREIVSLYAAHTGQAAAQYLLVEGLAGVLLGIVLFYSIRHLGRCDRRWISRAAVGGAVVVAISLLQCLLGLVLVYSTSKGHLSQSGNIYQLVNRLDGAKQLMLSACVVMLGLVLRTTSSYPLWLGRTAVILGVALVASGLTYLLLWNVLAGTTYVSLPLLIVWVAGTGIWLGAESQRELHPIASEDLVEHLPQDRHCERYPPPG